MQDSPFWQTTKGRVPARGTKYKNNNSVLDGVKMEKTWYDAEEDILNIGIKKGTYWKSIELQDGIVVDISSGISRLEEGAAEELGSGLADIVQNDLGAVGVDQELVSRPIRCRDEEAQQAVLPGRFRQVPGQVQQREFLVNRVATLFVGRERPD